MNRVINFPTLSYSRPAEDDIETIAEMINSIWHETYDEHLPARLCHERTVQVFRKQVRAQLNNATVACLGDKLVGYADHISNCVDNIWVKPNYRRRGIGSGLISQQLQQMREKDMQSAQAGCEVFNKPAKAFYTQLGWNVLDESVENIEHDLQVGIIVFGKPLRQET